MSIILVLISLKNKNINHLIIKQKPTIFDSRKLWYLMAFSTIFQIYPGGQLESAMHIIKFDALLFVDKD